jgi:iron complex outermembrane recepter protein
MKAGAILFLRPINFNVNQNRPKKVLTPVSHGGMLPSITDHTIGGTIMYGQFREFFSKAFFASLSSLLALLTFSSALHAQGSDVEEVVVTGFRGSLEQSLSVKRQSANAVDSIHAEDIADFPDLNLAESLQRIPGVAISRAGGEGRQVTVRGLGPDFTRVRINGMEALSTAGFTDALGGNNRARGFDFNSFDSDVFKSLTVHKTSMATLEEGALGASVELQTARPFDYKEFTLAATAQFGYNDRSEETDPRFSFLISDTFADGMFGALLAVSSSTRNIADEGSSTVRWSTAEQFGSANGVPLPAGPTRADHEVNLAWHPRLPRYDSYTQETERLGVNAALQFRPSESTLLNLDILQSKADVTRNEAFMQMALNNNGAVAATDISNYQIRSNAIVAADLSNVTLLSETRHDEITVDFKQYVLSLEQDLTDTLRLNAMVGNAESEFDNPVQRYVILTKTGTASYDMTGSEGAHFDFGPEASALSGWTISNFRKREPYTLHNIDQAELSIEFDLSDNLTLKGGINQKNYEFETSQAQMVTENTNGGLPGVIDSSFLRTYDAGPLGSWAAPNHDAFQAAVGFYNNAGVFATSTDNSLANVFAVEEDTQAIFVQLDFNFELGGIPMRGNIGARKFETDQTSAGIANLADGARVATVTYDDTLPALNLVADLTDNLVARFAWSEVIVRPGMGLLRPVSTVNVAGSNRTVTGNNPGLGPTTATATDLGLEWYFAEESLLSVAFFTKEIDTFIQTIVQNIPFTETGLPIQQAIDACEASPSGYGESCNENLLWNVNAPGNSPGGDLEGYEISYQQPFTGLPGIWANFGAIINYTNVEATIDYLGVVGGETVVVRPNESLINLSDSTTNLTLYYEGDAFSARVSIADRGDYLTNVPGRNSTFVEYTKGTNNIDVSASYVLSDNLKLTFEGLNLTDEGENQRLNVRQPSTTAPNDAPEAPSDVVSYYHQTGKQYFIGARFTY